MPLKPAKSTNSTKPKPKPSYEFLKSSDGWTRFTMMLYGAPGIGKTWFAGTAAQVPILQPILVLDSDGGYRTLQGKKQFEGLDIIRIRTFKELSQVYNDLVEPGKYRTVILENIGEIHNFAMDDLMAKVISKDANREEYVPSMREYGIVRKQILKVLKYFTLNETSNLIVTCHAKKDKNELTQRESVYPSIPGKLATDIPGYVDIVGYMSIEEPNIGDRNRGVTSKRVVRFQPSQKVEAKDQSDMLGEVLEDPTMEKVVKLIQLKRAV